MVELDTAPVTFQLTRCFPIDKIMPVLRKPLGIVGFAPTMSWKGEQPAGGAEPQVEEGSSVRLQGSDPLLPCKVQETSGLVCGVGGEGWWGKRPASGCWQIPCPNRGA